MVKRDFSRLEAGTLVLIFVLSLTASIIFFFKMPADANAVAHMGTEESLSQGLSQLVKACSEHPLLFEDTNSNGALDDDEDVNFNGLIDPHPAGIVLQLQVENSTISFQVESGPDRELDPEGDGLVEEADANGGIDYNGDGDRRDVFLLGRLVRTVRSVNGEESGRKTLFSGLLLPLTPGGDIDGDGVADPLFQVIRREEGMALQISGLVVHSRENAEVKRSGFSRTIPLK